MSTEHLLPAGDDVHQKNSTISNSRDFESDEEVRSKVNSSRRRYESSSATCGDDGVKSIADILSCADEQLRRSKEFADKLARRR